MIALGALSEALLGIFYTMISARQHGRLMAFFDKPQDRPHTLFGALPQRMPNWTDIIRDYVKVILGVK